MNVRYLRHNLFYRALKPFSEKQRANRMQMFSAFLSQCGIQQPRILDLGGHPDIWKYIQQPLQITIVNLPGNVVRARNTIHNIKYIEGDACNVTSYKDYEFDIVFSNSVIEHVGNIAHQENFAKEVRRLAKQYWVQTPSKYFPVEAHCGMPFWWFYPKPIREALLSKWQKKLPGWTNMIIGTRVLEKKRMAELFPDSEIIIEKYLGFHKSYIAHT